MTKTVVIGGSLAQKPRHGGHTWVFLQYLLGFRRLGWDVLFLDQLEPTMCFDATGRPSSFEESLNLSYFLEVMEHFDLQGAYALIHDRGKRCVGLTRRQVLERVKSAALVINIMGYITDVEILSCAPRRVFLDIDPGFPQMWRELGLADLFRGHDHYVTIGENIGRAGCAVPTCGLKWITTRQPVVLDYWRPRSGSNGEWFTTVASWRGPYDPIEFRGRTYGLRAHEFRKFARLPRLSGRPFQLALDIHRDEVRDLELLRSNGWSLVDPRAAAGNPQTYQKYVQRSKAEFMVAKNLYVLTSSGWFSDRSMCYLASGKPVLAQDTGYKHLLPTGEGLITFTTLDEALSGAEKLWRDYDRHVLAARALAEEYFDSDKVLSQLLSKLGVA